MSRKILVILVVWIVIFSANKLSFAMMGMCDMGGGSGKGHSGHAEAAETSSSAQKAAEEVGNKICPVSGEHIKEGEEIKVVEHEGKAYNLCCKMCEKDFKKNPKKYIEKLEAQEEKEAAGHEGHAGHAHKGHEGH